MSGRAEPEARFARACIALPLLALVALASDAALSEGGLNRACPRAEILALKAKLDAVQPVRPEDVSWWMPLPDHAHALMAFGARLRLAETSIDGAAGVRGAPTYLEWLLGDHQTHPAPPRWLVERGGSMRVLLRERPLSGRDGEAHPGQLLFYACGGFARASCAQAIGVVRELIAPEAIDALGSELFLGGDNDFAIPVLIKLSARERWARRFGDEICLRTLIAAQLKEDPSVRPCFGLHWATCASIIGSAPSDRVEQELRLRAAALADRTAAVLVSRTTSRTIALPWRVWGRSELHDPAWISLCAHCIEFLAAHGACDRWAVSAAARMMARTLVEVPDERWAELPFNVRCHAAVAAARMAAAIDRLREGSARARRDPDREGAFSGPSPRPELRAAP